MATAEYGEGQKIHAVLAHGTDFVPDSPVKGGRNSKRENLSRRLATDREPVGPALASIRYNRYIVTATHEFRCEIVNRSLYSSRGRKIGKGQVQEVHCFDVAIRSANYQ